MLMLRTASSVCREATSASCEHADVSVQGLLELRLLVPRPEQHGRELKASRRHSRCTSARRGQSLTSDIQLSFRTKEDAEKP